MKRKFVSILAGGLLLMSVVGGVAQANGPQITLSNDPSGNQVDCSWVVDVMVKNQGQYPYGAFPQKDCNPHAVAKAVNAAK